MPAKGTKQTKEAKEKIRLSKLGSKNPRFGKSPWNKGLPILKEVKEKLIEANKNRVFTEEERLARSERMKGQNHWNWQGGKSDNRHKTNSFEYVKWRSKVFERDNWTCQTCGKRGIKLVAHHVKSWAHYPELRFVVDNGVSLCEVCHSLTDNFRGRWVLR